MNKTSEEKVAEILNELGIEMSIGGCGCCDSPWFTMKYKGEVIVDDESFFHFSNLSQDIDD